MLSGAPQDDDMVMMTTSCEAQDTLTVSGHIMDMTHEVTCLRWLSWQTLSVRAERVRQQIQHPSWIALQKLVRMRNNVFQGVQVQPRHLVTKAWQARHFMPRIPTIYTAAPNRLLISSCGLLPVVTVRCPHNVWPLYRDHKVTQSVGKNTKVCLLSLSTEMATENHPSPERSYRRGEVWHSSMSKAVLSL